MEEKEQLGESQKLIDEAGAIWTTDWFRQCAYDQTPMNADNGIREISPRSAQILGSGRDTFTVIVTCVVKEVRQSMKQCASELGDWPISAVRCGRARVK
jgi:hypothetical protein